MWEDDRSVVKTTSMNRLLIVTTMLKNAAYQALEKLAGFWTDYLVVVNREDEEAANRYSLVESARVRYIPGTGFPIVSWSRCAWKFRRYRYSRHSRLA